VLHHVSIEVEPDRVRACAECLQLLGFELVEVPEALGPNFTWLERGGTQVHLIHTEHATVPYLGHAAVIVGDFEATFAALEEAGHTPERHRELWGEPRAFVTLPGGHRVEFMAAPPSSGRAGTSG